MSQDATKSSKAIPLKIPEHQDSSSGTETQVEKQVDLPPSDDDARFWTRPKIKQYWHSANNIDTSVLFVDLLYVGIIAVNADTTIEGPTRTAFLRFSVTFLPTWKIWSDISILVSQFEIGNVTERSIILFILACLVGYTTNIHSALCTTYAQLVAFYLAARIAVAIVTVVLAIFIPRIRPIMLLNLISIIIPMAFWVRSCFLDIYTREPLIWLAICWAVDVQDRLQRVGAFVSLIFGYSVVGILYQSLRKFGLNAFFGKAVLALVQEFCFNWIYFDVDEKYHQAQPAKRHTISAVLWFNAHLPFIMSYTLSSAALSKLVVAHDCPNAGSKASRRRVKRSSRRV
ncbi:hypothetical protein FRC04_004646 [Tulasnella sp. 424]|nr:hypothetical protein FRC04_004646 [Tulasnella sp. 424]KAG8963949.1 hypothetical protein FRC05_004351 [Tulasnella sp. 425]